ncbi:YhdP family protein [uncultured Propionivibrio sp.]|uniref:YhdP family protein n=1 Tax=uncultured Propionivibrio sp. TaxID=426737 RepID=UPI0029C02254|nr:YhdP family protein [uncultured Propionivibrio sp.]
MTVSDLTQTASGRPLSCMRSLLSRPWVRRLVKAIAWGLGALYFAFVVAVLALRYSILPDIERHRPVIEDLVSQGLGQSVSIGRIEASWSGINPDLSLFDVQVKDAAGRPALAFSRVEAILSWWSVPRGKVRLRLLRIDSPTLNLRRDASGQLFVAGIPLSTGGDGADVSDWILGLRKIRIDNATLVWEDALRQAPPLRLEALNFALDNFGRSHRFGLTARPPAELASPIDVRGDLRGSDLDDREDWTGTMFAQIDDIDLAVWRQWVDYPFALPHGRGALRAWLGVDDGAVRELTADLALQNASMRLAQNLPSLDLASLSGRISVRLDEDTVSVKGRQVALETRPESGGKQAQEPIRVEPTDFSVDWQMAAEGGLGTGKASASRLDLTALGRLAERMPLDAQTRALLADYAPNGRVADLSVRWRGNAERLQTYSLKARFDGMGLKANGYFPGFAGVSGALDASETGGNVTIQSERSSIDLPTVFPSSHIDFDALNVRAQWKINKTGLEADLTRIEFAGPDAAGTAQGRYRNSGEGPGTIDLTAALTRADARAVWRYMPRVVGDATRNWLRDSLLSGRASEAKLMLKGNLEDFPFVDKSKGIFLVTVKAEDVDLDYGDGWPKLSGIHGNLRFEGKGMVVDAQSGSILGAKVSRTRAEIPDLDALDPVILVKGQADGATSEFLKFIDQSPVAERIDRFTDTMQAVGNGHLDLSLKIPLDEKKLSEAKIDGAYRFQNNEVTVDTALPPLRQVNGSVQFSGSDLRIPEINANLFGGPLKIRGGLQRDGRVVITAQGTVNIEALRKQGDMALLSRLSGATNYRGEVHINKRNADLIIDSNLAGLASTLPAPFAKTASENLPFHFEKRLLPTPPVRRGQRPSRDDGVVRDQLSASLGQSLSLQLVRRKQSDGFVVERGGIGIGRTQVLPESGVALGVTLPQVDLDAWRAALRGGAKSTGAASGPSLVPDAINIRTPDLVFSGRRLRDVDLSAQVAGELWRLRVNARQISGDLQWNGSGRGKLTARLKQFVIDSTTGDEPETVADDPVRELPGLDVIAEDFQLGTRRFGRLELLASNEGGVWKLGRIQMSNPHAVFTGSGQWVTAGGKNQTELDFKVNSTDVGALLERLGFPGAIRSATARLEGRLGWKGSPVAFDYNSLDGELGLDAAKGQFLKIDPGAGKLVSLISLQSLPRRITLDFRDIFSEGLAFDAITAKLAVSRGVMSTDRLQIDSTAARIVMRGEVDLKHETQRLNVNVQPEIGSTAALGIALVHPVVGVATYLAHKVLQNPLNQMFGFDYLVTGTWADPKVEKQSSLHVPSIVPRLPGISPSGAANEPSAK